MTINVRNALFYIKNRISTAPGTRLVRRVATDKEHQGMKDRQLARELILIVIVKVIAIAALWWAVVRDTNTTVTPQAMEARINQGAQPTSQGHPHDQ
ncbi:MAG: hypothetical protein FHP92_06455 [Denitromonas halophila]|nr:MAG: hypothetical protein FHP92_06455 [Denitromonas halophila]